jgi:hypothetical protein
MAAQSDTHAVGEAGQQDAVDSQQDVALAQLAGLICGLVWEEPLDSNEAGPLLPGLDAARHAQPQASAALHQAHLERSFCNTRQTEQVDQNFGLGAQSRYETHQSTSRLPRSGWLPFRAISPEFIH